MTRVHKLKFVLIHFLIIIKKNGDGNYMRWEEQIYFNAFASFLEERKTFARECESVEKNFLPSSYFFQHRVP